MTCITGHRGARNLWPENSLGGFRKTLELGVDAVEFDIHLTDAGEMLVIHDATLDRTVEGSGAIAKLDPAARAALRLKDSAEGIPLLDTVLALFAEAPDVVLHAEIKADAAGNPYPGLEAMAAEALRRHGLAGRSYLTSFNPAVLEECRRVAADIPRVISMTEESAKRFGGFEQLIADADGLAEIVAVHHPMLDARWQAISSRLLPERLCAWTLNEPDLIRLWLQRGIGHITTDRPDLGLAIRAEAAGAQA